MGKQTTKALPKNDHLTDLEAEQSVLGAILLKPDALYDVAAVVQPETFYREDHRLIYQAMLDLAQSGQAVDLVTVTARLKDLDLLGRAGGPVFLADLSEHVGTAANVVHYANRVRDKALIRNLRDAALQIASTCEQPCLSAKELMDWAEARVYEKCRHPGAAGGPQAIEILVHRETEVLAEIHQTKKPPGLSTGYLDRFMSWGPGDLAVLAGRTSMGKTSLALNLALKVALAGSPVGFFSLEMSQEQITRRLLAINGKIDATRLNRVRLSAEEWVALYQAKDDLAGLPLWIDGTPSLSVMEIRSGARRVRAKGELDFLVVDYLQLVRPYRRGLAPGGLRLSVEQALDRLVAEHSHHGGLFHRSRNCRQRVVLEQHQDPNILPGAALAFPAVPQLPVIGLIYRRQRPPEDRCGPGERGRRLRSQLRRRGLAARWR